MQHNPALFNYHAKVGENYIKSSLDPVYTIVPGICNKRQRRSQNGRGGGRILNCGYFFNFHLHKCRPLYKFSAFFWRRGGGNG